MTFKKGEILSETSYYTIEEVIPGKGIKVKMTDGSIQPIGEDYAKQYFKSADNFLTEKKLNMTELADLFIKSSNIAVTVNFNKKVDENNVAKEMIDLCANTAPSKIQSVMKKAVKQALKGNERVMKGYHKGVINELGRIQFIDMEADGYNIRQVDPRTINYLIVDNIKYILK